MNKQRTLWPNVTSQVARRVLTHLFNTQECKTDRADISDYGADFRPSDVEYALRLRARLKSSTLAEQLATGPGAIPDIADATQGIPAQLLSLFRPRTLEEYVNYLVSHLGWVLDPSANPDLREYIYWDSIGAHTLRVIHSTELYWYLRQAYSDSGAPDELPPDPANPHVVGY